MELREGRRARMVGSDEGMRETGHTRHWEAYGLLEGLMYGHTSL